MYQPIDLDDGAGKVISIDVIERHRARRSKDGQPACAHARITVDRALAKLQCRDCKAELSPVEWIARAAESWSAVQALYERQKEAARVLDIKERAKCPHCHRISEIRRPTAAEIRAWDAQERSRKIADGSIIVIKDPPPGASGSGSRRAPSPPWVTTPPSAPGR